MVNFILEYKWVLLILSEVVFWITFCIFLILRYWFHSRGQLLFLYLSIINQFLNIPLAGLDFMQTGQVSFFQIVILSLYICAIVRGPKDMLRLDRFIQAKVSHWQRERRYFRSMIPVPEMTVLLEQYPIAMRRKFYAHITTFAIVHICYFSTTLHISSIWFPFLIIDGIWSLSFTYRK